MAEQIYIPEEERAHRASGLGIFFMERRAEEFGKVMVIAFFYQERPRDVVTQQCDIRE